MGTFSVAIEVGDPQGERWERVEALVGTEVAFTVVPASLLERLGVQRRERQSFRLPDETTVERDIGFTQVRVNDKSGLAFVVFEEEGKPPILGWHTLDGLLLKVDPESQRLVPIDAIPWHEHPRPVPELLMAILESQP